MGQSKKRPSREGAAPGSSVAGRLPAPHTRPASAANRSPDLFPLGVIFAMGVSLLLGFGLMLVRQKANLHPPRFCSIEFRGASKI
jgi:hypothetical protein